jgi:glucose-6-phosphate 1-dehydrogenase
MTETPETQPTTLVIFGATGDLAHRSLWPAIYNLAAEGLLPEQYRIVGVAFDVDHDTFAAEMAGAVQQYSRSGFDEPTWQRIVENLRYVRGSFTEHTLYDELAQTLRSCAEEIGSEEVVFYLAVAPKFVTPISAGLQRVGYGREDPRVRIVCEKPFGHDLPTALTLNEDLHQYFDESQIFRMDHYLGKETVQNLMVLRFANGIYEPLWNRNYVESVEISVAEPEGVGSRAGYYDTAGALRDVLQNHMMQLLCYVGMEPPRHFDADSIRAEKTKVLAAARVRDPEHDVVRGQYVPGPAGKGYLEEDNVPSYSKTETYVAVRLEVDNWRWAGTPFYLRTGKRLPAKMAEIVVRFKPAPHLPFASKLDQEVKANQLIITLQPDEGMALTTTAKVPGQEMKLQSVALDFDYSTSFPTHSPQAYERLIHDVIDGDATLFQHADEVEAAWRIVQPLLDRWQADSFDLRPYPAGSEGPVEAARLRDTGRWRKLIRIKHQ